MDKNVEIAYLLDAYGGMLSERRLRIMEMRYTEDLTLGEIAELLGITRQGAHEAAGAAVQQLRAYEDRLHIVSERQRVREALREAIQALETGDTSRVMRILSTLEGGGDDGV